MRVRGYCARLFALTWGIDRTASSSHRIFFASYHRKEMRMNVPCSIVAREHASSFAENHKQRFTARCATLVGCDVCVTSLAISDAPAHAQNKNARTRALAFFYRESDLVCRLRLSVATMASVMGAAIAVFRADLACDFRTGRIADDAACDEANRTENDRSGKAAERCIGHAFMCAGCDGRQKKTGYNHNTTCKSFHWFVPRVCRSKRTSPESL
jgi:hypothetical protein